MKKLYVIKRGGSIYLGFHLSMSWDSILLMKLPFENYRDDPRLRNYVDDEQEFKVVVSNESKVLFKEAIAWINETVEGPWSVRAEGSSPTIFQFSFSDLQIATLFRLRF